MMALLIGWQIYQLTGSALDLGLVGLIQFVPAVVLTLLIGHAADRYDRRLIVRAAQPVLCASRAGAHPRHCSPACSAAIAVRRGLPDRLRPCLRNADRARWCRRWCRRR